MTERASVLWKSTHSSGSGVITREQSGNMKETGERAYSRCLGKAFYR